jgi:hypothetical protein
MNAKLKKGRYKMKLSDLKVNPDNPRLIKDARCYKKIVFICKSCGMEFKSKKAHSGWLPVYCSRKCYGESIKKYKICGHCGKPYANWTRDKYCSMACARDARKGMKFSEEWKKALSDGRKNSPKCKGPNLYNWKGGPTTYLQRAKISNNQRRARFLDAGKLDPIFLGHLWDIHKGLCFYCGQSLINHRCLEHLTALSRGGGNEPYNFVYSCKSCNSKKRQKSLEDYAIATRRIWLVDKWEDFFIEAYSRTKETKCNTPEN